MNDKALGMIGLAKRAGKTVTGTDFCIRAVKDGKAKLVITACDASENTKKAISSCCRFYNVHCIEAYSKSDIGKYTGADCRAVVSVTDDNFAKAILDRLNKSPRGMEKGSCEYGRNN